MAISLNEATAAIEGGGFRLRRATAKVAEYESISNGQILYLRVNQGFPDHADVAIHPEASVTPILSIPGIEPNKRVEFRFGSNMSAFPKRLNDGQSPQHFGRALYALSPTALSALCKEYGQQKC